MMYKITKSERTKPATHGGANRGQGKKLKFGEESSTITVRVPLSQKERLKPLVIKFVEDNIKSNNALALNKK